MEPMGTQMPERKSGSGALVGSIIVIILLIVGALYLWGAKLNSGESAAPADEELGAMEQDLASADLGGAEDLGSDVAALEAELAQ